MKKIFLLLALTMAVRATADTPLYLDPTADLEARVEDALSRMTFNEKVAMCHAQSKFSAPGVARLGIPDLWMSDGPHGVRAEISWDSWKYAGHTNDSVTAFPALTALAATWNPALAEEYGEALAEEALYRGKDVILGPGVNIYRTPLNGRNFEYMGEDPFLAGEMVVPYIKGMQRNGVAACVKHFALNNQEKWRDHIDVRLSDRALREIYLPAFRRAVIDGGAWSVMGAYNKVRGQHACHNEMLINNILKGEWGFDGVVITDWGGAHDTREAALNGLDLEMGTFTNGLTSESAFTTDDYYLADPYKKLLRSGEVAPSTLDDKVRRLLRLNFRTAMRRDKPFGSLCSEKHYDVAERVSNEAIVLLKNDTLASGTTLLPLDPGQGRRILVVGENATRNLMKGGGSSELKPKDIVTPLDGLRDIYSDNIRFTQGYASGRPMYGHSETIAESVTDSLRHIAVDMAREADVVIFVGGLNKNHGQDCEGGDREEYGLPFGQPELIEALAEVNPNLIVTLLSGNAVGMEWADKVPAILQAWYLGSMAGNSIGSVISGSVNPSGKLPFSFPVNLEDNSAHHFGQLSYPGDSITQDYADDILVGYRWHDTKGIPARYPFGYGMSYTTFRLDATPANVTMSGNDKTEIKVKVTNTGKRAGSDTLQLYVAPDPANTSLERPVKELKAFRKVWLEPGATTEVTFAVTPDMFACYDPDSNGFVAFPGQYEILIGTSSTNFPISETISYRQ
ncbi:MAG: glycoside hydrolase family 3 C-terminal domain-containing protein [Duncaniella sp.]|nr:glycoside hydrolase family 3 C-terminal domain-containing protein [Duncaniella sp.]